MKNLYLFTLALALLVGCAKDLGYHKSIQGSWKAINWTVESKDNREVANVKFSFDEQGYQAVLGGREEQGSYRVEGDKLYTHADGQQEMMVRIAHLANDSLEFEMNRGGVKENLFFVKE